MAYKHPIGGFGLVKYYPERYSGRSIKPNREEAAMSKRKKRKAREKREEKRKSTPSITHPTKDASTLKRPTERKPTKVPKSRFDTFDDPRRKREKIHAYAAPYRKAGIKNTLFVTE